VNWPLLRVGLSRDEDVVAARQRGRLLAGSLGFDVQDQARIATAVSEISRNAISHGGGGTAEFAIEGQAPDQSLLVRITDHGPGIADLEAVLGGTARSPTGPSMGIACTRRLVDRFEIESGSRGTTVRFAKRLPRGHALARTEIAALAASFGRAAPPDEAAELRTLNRELLASLAELRARQEDLRRVNTELEDTNRGVVALYAELDEKADHLRRADEVKSRFLSNMSHEFRTPLNSILALSRLLLDRADGPLTSEQEVQVGFIRKSADSLYELVNDLLDLAKVEAGKTDIRPTEFEAGALFGALRGMLRPLLISSTLSLIFEEPIGVPAFFSDEGKISQILRNFISNALKFTEAGEVRVSVEYDPATSFATFRVADTGIGIAPEDRETIFREFTQLESHIQRRVKGTGLGLPLSKRLAELLGGNVAVESEPGKGSVFSLALPLKWKAADAARQEEPPAPVDDSHETVLLVEDNFETRLAYERYLRSSRWHVASARSVREAENILSNVTPVAVVLDIALRGEDSWNFLADLKSNPATAAIPVVVATSVDDRAKAMALGADAYLTKPLSARDLRQTLRQLTGPGLRKVLLVDDEEVSRYLLKQLFGGGPDVRFIEAGNGDEALSFLRAERPDLVVLDLMMPVRNGFDTLAEMNADFDLRDIPVVVSSSKVLSEEERRHLNGLALAVLPKSSLGERGALSDLAAALASVGLGDLLEDRKAAGHD
jgi:signal transduction histidine kinase/DNA-binding response OmpR family regulator